MQDLQSLSINQFPTNTIGPVPVMPIGTNPTQPNKNIFNEPSNLTGWQLISKTATGLLIGGVISALLFVILTFMGSMFIGNLGQTGTIGGVATKANPLLPLILLFIGFLSTFIGNIAVAGLYNLFYSKKYFDISKVFGLLLLTNGILFFILAPIYLIFSKQTSTLFMVLGFHTLFSVFVSACQIEFSSNPNYSGSALMGNTIGFASSLLVYSLIYQGSTGGDTQQQTYLLMLLPAVLSYTLTPFGAGIREKIYYKFYEMGNNAFYISSPGESTISSEEKAKQEIEDINIG